MVVRVAGLAYQRGFGGHFHNDNSLAVLRDIPGLVLAVAEPPGRRARAAAHLLRLAAATDGRVCVFLEPIARYHTRDLHEDGDGALDRAVRRAGRDVRSRWARSAGTATGGDVLLVTFGNGVQLSRRRGRDARARTASRVTVLDLRWLAPLPVEALVAAAARASARSSSSTRPGAAAASRRASSRPSSTPAYAGGSPGSPAPTASSRSAPLPRRAARRGRDRRASRTWRRPSSAQTVKSTPWASGSSPE